MKNLYTPEENMIIQKEYYIKQIKKEIKRLEERKQELKKIVVYEEKAEKRTQADIEMKYTTGMIWGYENAIEILEEKI